VVSQYLVENLIEAGAEKLFIILGDGKADIMRYYGDGRRFGADIIYLYQEELRGMPNALDLARAWLGPDHTVLFGMPDTIVEPRSAFADLLAHHRDTDVDLSLGLFPTSNPSKFGMVDFDADGRVRYTIDKPKETKLTHMWGIACWSPRFTSLMGRYLKTTVCEGSEIVLGDVFNHALDQGFAAQSCLFDDGQYIDIGTTRELDYALSKFRL